MPPGMLLDKRKDQRNVQGKTTRVEGTVVADENDRSLERDYGSSFPLLTMLVKEAVRLISCATKPNKIYRNIPYDAENLSPQRMRFFRMPLPTLF